MWFRRDLRLADHPALAAAVAAGGADGVVACFVVDDALCAPAGPARAVFLAGCLEELDQSVGGRLVIRAGDPVDVVPGLAAEVGATEVFVTADAGPYGRRRDAGVARALARSGRALQAVGTPYAVAPGTVLGASGAPVRVFTAFHRRWAAAGRPPPRGAPGPVRWRPADSDALPGDLLAASARRRPAWWGDLPAGRPEHLPGPGEAAARARLEAFVTDGLAGYEEGRDQLGTEGTSRLSPYLRFGCLHPRQVLATLGRSPSPGAARFESELAWREFYADVLFHHPTSAHAALQPTMAGLAWDTGPAAQVRFARWATGTTGYPVVDAAMRQLLAEGWVHNRARMVAASFLVKDLHLDWRWGARWFMYRLVDGDLASNQHGWQWTAGTGTDAAPFHRIFNPLAQGRRFDPDGRYVRRYVPELSGLAGGAVHDPSTRPDPAPTLPLSGAGGYPAPMVDHARERAEALRRFAEARGAGTRGRP